MTLVDKERAFVRVLVQKAPAEGDLSALAGKRERWLLYRDMVRTRMEKLMGTAIPRTIAAIGEPAFSALHDTWLDEAPPRTRYFRELPSELARFAAPRLTEPVWARDLLAWEITRWEVGFEEVSVPGYFAELAFEKRAVMNPTLRVLRLEHAVHDESRAEPEKKPTAALVWRRLDNDNVAWRIPSAPFVELVEAFLAGDASITDAVKRVAAEQRVAIDERFVERLGTELAELVSRGAILGAR